MKVKRSIFAAFGIVALLAGLSVTVHAVTITQEFPVDNVGTPFCVSISTSAWTKFSPAAPATPLVNRTGIKLNVPSTNSARVAGVLSKLAPTVSTTTASISVATGSNPFIPVSLNIYLYLVSNNTSAETVCGQEVRQAY